ncbi:MAG: hypothetical protein ACK5U4_14525 [Rhodospirillales bacterium]
MHQRFDLGGVARGAANSFANAIVVKNHLRTGVRLEAPGLAVDFIRGSDSARDSMIAASLPFGDNEQVSGGIGWTVVGARV